MDFAQIHYLPNPPAHQSIFFVTIGISRIFALSMSRFAWADTAAPSWSRRKMRPYFQQSRSRQGGRIMKRWIIAAVGAASMLFAGVAAARVDIGVNIGVPGPVYYSAPPVYIAPPVYHPPVYYAPPPVYYPPPRYYAPRPVNYGPGYHPGPRHWDRHDRGHRHHGRGPGQVQGHGHGRH